MRLNKFIAEATGLSRRQADDAIAEGRVSVDGQTAILGQPVTDKSMVTMDGKDLDRQDYLYLLLNKPINYVCSRKQQDDKPTIYSLLPEKYQSLKTAGRLDADSHGLVLLTNDGDYAHQLTHPSYGKTKMYLAKLDKQISDAHIKQLNEGVQLEDGVSKFEVKRESDQLKVTMHEGRNRQIRRTFTHLGYDVDDLFRISFGDYKLEDLGDEIFALVSKKSVVNSV